MHYVKYRLFIEHITPTIIQLSEKCFNPSEDSGVCMHCSLNCGKNDKHDDECLFLIGRKVFLKFIKIDSDSSLTFNYKKEKRETEEILNIRNNYKVNAFLEEIKNNLHFFIQKQDNDPSNEGVMCPCTVFSNEYSDHTPDCEYLILSNALIKLFSK